MWLNKLGAAAAAGQSVVIRQTFYHGHYALIGEDLQPNPDFWVSALYKKLVGRKVFKINGHENNGNTLRLFAHCSKKINYHYHDAKLYQYPRIVIFGLNLSNRTEVVELESRVRIREYKLSPSYGNLSSRGTLLNGKSLYLENGWKVPALGGKGINELKLGPYEMAFWTYNEAKYTNNEMGVWTSDVAKNTNICSNS